MNIYKAIPKAMADIGAVAKNKKNSQQGYSFRGIDDFLNAIHGPLIKHGLFIVPTVLDSTREERQTKSGGTLIYTMLKVSFKVFADDGSFVEAVTVGEGMDSGDKSSNKAMSAALKYAIISVFAIPIEELKDSEDDSPDPATGKATVPLPPPHEPEEWRPGEEIIRLGKNKGKKFSELSPKDMRAMINWLEANKITSDDAAHYVQIARIYMEQLETQNHFGRAVGK